MSTPLDVLVLGGFVFTNFAVPETLPGGGKHQLHVHKLPGGDRVIDAMGPDDDDRNFEGLHVGSGALDEVLTLDQMRIAGAPLGYSNGAEARVVVISSFTWKIEKFNVIHSSISLTPIDNPSRCGVRHRVVAGHADPVRLRRGWCYLGHQPRAVLMIPAQIEAARALLRSSVAAARPLNQASPLLKAALVTAGANLLTQIDTVITTIGAPLDANDPTGFAGELPDWLLALATAADDQATLVDMRGTIGRAIFNLRQA